MPLIDCAMSAFGPKQTWAGALHMSAIGGKADIDGVQRGTPAGRHYARRGRIDPDRGRRNRARAPQVVARLLFTRAARSAGPG
jgi:hypothetical protein